MPTKRKGFKRGVTALLFALLAASYVAYVCTQPLAALTPIKTFTYTHAAQTVPLSWPSYGEAAIGAEGFGVLNTHGADAPLPTASVIKIMTALAVLHAYPLKLNETGPLITIAQADVDSYNKYVAENGSVVRVTLGEQISEYQALEAMLLPSANNIAETLARWAFGSLDAYNTYANAYAPTIGMTHTTVTDPSGFLPTTISTPHDLVLLGETALADPVIAQIVGESSAIIPVQGTIHNVNRLLGQDGIIGIKTGNNDQDLGCFLFASKQLVGKQTVTIFGAVMDGPSLGAAMWDSLPLIRSAAAGFSDVIIAPKGTNVATYRSPWHASARAITASNNSLLVWNGAAVTASVDLTAISAPKEANAEVGTMTISYGSADDTYVPIVLDRSIYGPSILWRLTHPI